MTYKYWNGYRWCVVSQDEAQNRRARGQRVIERATEEDVPVAAPVVAPVVVVPPAFDLSDDDLERLTAPDGKE